MTFPRSEPHFEPARASSPTAHLLSELQLFGYRPFADEPDPRPLPEPRAAAGAIADIFDALVATLSHTRLEPDLDNLLWSTVNLFHQAVHRIERDLDTNEQAQKRGQEEQDGSEIRSVKLERLTREGQGAIERRNAMEFFRDEAALHYERHTGSLWRPRTGSKVNHRALTSAMIDSRDYLSAKRRAENEVTLPPGPRIALTGGSDYNDHALIWDKLDKLHARKHVSPSRHPYTIWDREGDMTEPAVWASPTEYRPNGICRVLALDGGGAKGFYTLGVLKEIEGMVNCPLYRRFDIVFGTSTGAIIASLIALGHSVDEIHALYKAHVPAVMRERSPVARSVALAKLSKEVFGTKTFEDVKTGVGVVTTRWVTQRPDDLQGQSSGSRSKGHIRTRIGVIADAVQASCLPTRSLKARK